MIAPEQYDQTQQPENLRCFIGNQHIGAVDIKGENDNRRCKIADAKAEHGFLISRRITASAHLPRLIRQRRYLDIPLHEGKADKDKDGEGQQP